MAEDEPARLPHRVHAARIEPRGVRAERAHADGDGIRAGAELVDAPPALLAAHPTASGNHDPAVERHRDLVRHERAALHDPGAPGLVLAARTLGELAARLVDVDARRSEPLQTAARLRVRVARSDHDAGHARAAAGGRRTAACAHGGCRAPWSRRASRHGPGRRPRRARPPRRGGRRAPPSRPRRRHVGRGRGRHRQSGSARHAGRPRQRCRAPVAGSRRRPRSMLCMYQHVQRRWRRARTLCMDNHVQA